MEQMEKIGKPEHMADMYVDIRKMLKKLKKPTYEKNFQEFREKNGYYFQQMTAYVDQAEDKKQAGYEIGRQLTKEVREAFALKKGRAGGRINSGTQADLNLYTIFYVFPTLLMTESKDAGMIADCICQEWAKEFKGNNIRYTDYDTLYQSFRNKIFGIF